ncbi:hypothetical protein [Polaribacter sargassicola]|uniref:hypothetical protein n=1 Tax=Polaribacter sargassicola TaxID=2836891 RepID=UPI001F28FB79|nr:hypothetical protein [Polaribacter sp. DS7-9]MCG1036887.1 hypothetical protein [Polaribacter sp. DS7-9]
MKLLFKFKILVSLFIVFINFSCNNKDVPDGIWSDNIKLSAKDVTLSSNTDSIIINTEGEWWWIDEITWNGNLVTFDEIDTSSKDFIIEETEFSIERKNATEIHIKMTENETNSEKILFIGLQAGNYFDSIIVTQSAP